MLFKIKALCVLSPAVNTMVVFKRPHRNIPIFNSANMPPFPKQNCPFCLFYKTGTEELIISGLFAKVNFFQPKWKARKERGKEDCAGVSSSRLHARLYLWSGWPWGQGAPRSHLKSFYISVRYDSLLLRVFQLTLGRERLEFNNDTNVTRVLDVTYPSKLCLTIKTESECASSLQPIHQISVFPVNDWSSRARAGHLENISLERRGPAVGKGRGRNWPGAGAF